METVEAIPEPIPQRSDTTKAVRNVFNRHIAHEGIMLDRMQRQLRNAEKLQRFAATGKVEDLPNPGEDDDMAVNIGNEYHLHEVMPPATQPTSTTPVAVIASATRSSLWPLVLGASLPLAGMVGGWALHSWFTPPPATAGVDTDTITELDFPTKVGQ